MPSISNQFDAEGRPLMRIAITDCGSIPGRTSWRMGLIDTGANLTGIAPSIVFSLRLSPVGTVGRASSTHSGNTNLYLGDLHISYLRDGVETHYTFQDLHFNDFLTPHPNFEVLIGRDVLSKGVLVVDGPAKQLSFRW